MAVGVVLVVDLKFDWNFSRKVHARLQLEHLSLGVFAQDAQGSRKTVGNADGLGMLVTERPLPRRKHLPQERLAPLPI